MIGDILRCPNCGEHLQPTDRGVACANRHAFDRAKEGSIHLLPQSLRSKAEGDSPQMLRARRGLFDAGHYAAVQNAVAAEVKRLCADLTHPVVVDVGCGEGAYLGAVAQSLEGDHTISTTIGVDVAGYGVKRAAARHKTSHFFVSDVYRGLPLADHSVDVVTDIFAPRDASEFSRILSNEGAVVVVIPAETHLGALRSIAPLISIHADKEDRLRTQFAASFTAGPATSIEWTMTLMPNELLALVDMTPSARHLSDEDRSSISAMKEPLDVGGSVRMLTFKRTAP